MENLRERQENEIIALKSIFWNDFEDLRNDKKPQVNKEAKRTNQNIQLTNNNNVETNANLLNVPLVRITLFPQNSQSQDNRHLYVQIDLKVKFTPNYPNELPKMNLENEKGKCLKKGFALKKIFFKRLMLFKGLSTDLVKKLYRELIQKANTLLGGEMIYELCQHVQEFLYQHNKPPTKSFYEQRLENRLNLEKELEFEEKKQVFNETDLVSYIWHNGNAAFLLIL